MRHGGLFGTERHETHARSGKTEGHLKHSTNHGVTHHGRDRGSADIMPAGGKHHPPKGGMTSKARRP